MTQPLVLLRLLAALALLGAPAARADEPVLQTVDAANTRFSPLTQIDAGNVSRLKVAWTFSTGVLRGHEGAPLVVGSVMYVHTPFPNTIYALDLAHDGKILWRYAPRQDPTVMAVMCCDTVHRGLAYANGKLFLQQADTTLVALDPASGTVLWSVKNGDPGTGETNTATVLPVGDAVIVGLSGGEYGARCHVTAYDQATGARRWRAYAAGPDADILFDPEKTTSLGKPVGQDSSLKTWEGDQWRMGGGCAWGWFASDPDLGLVYYGTGNPSTWNPAQRPGDNKWAEAIIARDARTGAARWVYQMTPHDQWDFDGVNEMILTEQTIRGERRRVLTHFDRNGFGYTLDRATGALLVAEKFDPSVNWASRIEQDPARPDYGRPVLDTRFAPRRRARRRSRRASAPGRSAPRTSNPPLTPRRPACSTCRPTTCAWITSRSASPTCRASPMSARR